METPEVDLRGFMPQTIKIRVGEDEYIEVSSDQPPALVSQANVWLHEHALNSEDPNANPINVDKGWDLLNEMCGQDMRQVGVLGMVKLLHFFRASTSAQLQEIYSASPLGSVVSSTVESPSETSSEVPSSSENV